MAQMTLTRRILVAFVLSSLTVIGYVLIFHDPLIAAQKQQKTKYDALSTRNVESPSVPALQKEAVRLREENEALKKMLASAQPTRQSSSQFDIQKAVFKAVEEADKLYPRLYLNFLNPADLPADLRKKTGSSEENTFFKLQGGLNGIYQFLGRLPHLPGIPKAWAIETLRDDRGDFRLDERGNLIFILWMEVAS